MNNTSGMVQLKGSDAQIKFAEQVRAKALNGIDAEVGRLTNDLAFESDPAQRMVPIDAKVVAALTARREYWLAVRSVMTDRLSSAAWLLDRRGGIYPTLVDLPYFVDTVAKLASITKPTRR